MVDKRGDPEIGDFGDQFRPLLKEWLTEFVVFLFYFEDLLTGLLIQPKRQITNSVFKIISECLSKHIPVYHRFQALYM